MKRTGVFLSYFVGERLKDFPQALYGILDKENVFYFDAHYELSDGLFYLDPASEELVLKVHSEEMVRRIKMTGDYDAALYSAGGTVHAAEEIWQGNIDNAFVFTSFGDHHAGRNRFGGMCYLNGAAIAIADLRDKGLNRFCIVDTDSHHADGTRDIFAHDRDVLHVCFCSFDGYDKYNNVDVRVPYGISDEEYVAKMKAEFGARAREFKPELIFWEFGYDATRGEYGDKGVSLDCHHKLVSKIKQIADEVCEGRLIVILCGGSGRRVASYTIPRIIKRLAELERDAV